MIKWIVPNLRFPEFEGEWEKKKLLDIGKIITGSTPSTRNEAFYNGEYLFVSPVDIQSNRYVKRTKTTLTKKGFEKGRKIPKGSSLFVCIGSTIGKVGQAKSICITNQQINSITSLEGSNDFLYSLLECHAPKIKILAAAQAVPIINKTTFSNIKINIPFSEEQSKIGSFFYLIDKKIDTQIKTIEELKNLKTGMSQRIFSQEVRFKNNDGKEFPDWEKKKMKDIFYAERGKGLSKGKLIATGENKCILYGELYTTYKEVIDTIVSRTDDVEGLESKVGDILMPSSTTTTGIDLANATALNEEGVLLGGDIIVLRPKIELNNIFYAYYLSIYKKYGIAKLAQGITIVHLYFSHLKNMKIYFPSLSEQQKIANFLSAIDKKIEVETQILKKLKEQKKFFLQNLFV